MNSVLARLMRLFFYRFFETESAEDARVSIGGVFAILALPATLMCFFLLQKYSSIARYFHRDVPFDANVESLADKYLFIVFCMALIGLVAVLRWDTLFPDRRDHWNLAPLPVRMRDVLLARVLALAGFIAALIADVNIGAAFIYPAIVMGSDGTAPQLLRFIAAHAVALFAAGAWVFFTVLAVTGAWMAILPFSVFRRTRRYVQFAGVVIFLGLFFSTALLQPEVKLLSAGEASWAEWFPPIWFLGLYQRVQGVPMGNLAPLSSRAGNALAVSAVLAAISYALAWRWHFLRSAEATDGPVRALRTPDWVFRLLDGTIMRSGFRRGAFRFLVKTVARSDRHSAAFATLMGIGVTLAFLGAVSPTRWVWPIPLPLLTANLILIYSLLTGLRLSFGIAAQPAANWVFRVAAHPEADPSSLVRRTLWCFALPLLALPTILFAVRYQPAPAVLHLFYATVCTAGLIELLSMGFRAVPFTCSWLPARNNPIFAIAGWSAGLAAFGPALAGFETVFLRAPATLVWVIAILGAISVVLRRTEKSHDKVAWADTRGDFDLLHLTE